MHFTCTLSQPRAFSGQPRQNGVAQRATSPAAGRSSVIKKTQVLNRFLVCPQGRDACYAVVYALDAARCVLMALAGGTLSLSHAARKTI